LPKYEYCRYQKILGNTGNTSIADTGRQLIVFTVSIRLRPVMSNYLTNIYQTLRDHAKYFDITGLLPLMLTILVLPVLLDEEY
jgi:hypothetical protein